MDLIYYLKNGYPIVIINEKEMDYVLDISQKNNLRGDYKFLKRIISNKFKFNLSQNPYVRYGTTKESSLLNLRYGAMSTYRGDNPFIFVKDFMVSKQISQDDLLNFLEEDNVWYW